jgi:hypothetical protein
LGGLAFRFSDYTIHAFVVFLLVLAPIAIGLNR